jgi:hypothetical protein
VKQSPELKERLDLLTSNRLYSIQVYYILFLDVAQWRENSGNRLISNQGRAVGSGSLIKLPDSLPRTATNIQKPWMNERWNMAMSSIK